MVPYATVDMLKYHTVLGVQTNGLVPGGGSPADQDAALAAKIEQASSWIDDQCQQVLAATLDVVAGQAVVARDGTVTITPRYRPVLAVTGASLGSASWNMAPLASLDGVGILNDTVTLSGWTGLGTTTFSGAPLQFGPPLAGPGRIWYQLDVLSGAAVTLLSASAALGATSIDVDDVTGIIEGQTQLVIYAGRARFRFIAGAVTQTVGGLVGAGEIGTGSGSVVCPALPQALVNNAENPIMVSALSPSVNKAVEHVVRAFVKDSTRGNNTTPTAGGKTRDPLGAGSELEMALQILNSGGYVAKTARTSA